MALAAVALVAGLIGHRHGWSRNNLSGSAVGGGKLLERAINAIPDGFAVYDRDDRLTLFNDTFLNRGQGVRRHLRRGMSFEDVVTLIASQGLVELKQGESQENWVARRLSAHRLPGYVEEHFIGGRWWEIREIRLPDGSTIVLEREISERRLAEMSLRHSEQRYRELVESSLQGIVVHRGGTLLFVNRAFAEMLGYDSVEEVLALGSVWRLVATEDRPWLRARSEARMQGEEVPSQYTTHGIRRDGTQNALFVSVRVVNWDGEPAVLGTCIDISERKAVEAALTRSEERYRGVVEDHSEMICRYRPDGTLTFVNGAYVRFFGGTKQSWVGRNYLDTLQPIEAARERLQIRSMMEEPRTLTSERINVDVFGADRCVEWVDRPLLGANGTVTEFQAVGHDISERKEIEEALIQSEARYRSIVNDQTDPIARFSSDLALTFVNEAGCRFFGSDQEQLLGRNLLDLVPERDRQMLRDLYDQRSIHGGIDTYEQMLTTPDGESRWFLWTIRCFKDRSGGVIEFQSVGRDITELKEIEERFRTFVENAPAAISIKDLAGNYLLVNRRFAEIVGLDPGAFVGKSAEAFFAETSVELRREHEAAVIASGEPIVREEELETEQGRMNFLTVNFPLISQSGETEGVAAIHTDITALKRAEMELADAKEEAEMANAAKTRFLSAASHDLRQPLHAMRLLLEALEDETDETRRVAMIEQLSGALGSMNNMLTALLDIGQLESGAVTPNIADFRIQQVLDPLVATLTPGAEEKCLLVQAIPCSVVVRSDMSLLSRILDNFLSNALRYTASGRILIGCRRLPESLRIEVWDTGAGVPEDKLDAIFEDYHQLGNPGRDRSKGLGLGLAIVDRLAKLLGHRLSLRSQIGKGSVFAVEVPRGQESTCESELGDIVSVDVGGEPRRVLVVEDDPLVASAAKTLLERWGIEALMVSVGTEALSLVREMDEAPDVVIADYRLPEDLTGIQVIEHLRALTGQDLPAIVITGDISTEIQDEAVAAGANLLRKPVEPAKLRALLRACVMAREPGSGVTPLVADGLGSQPLPQRASVR